MTTNNSLNTETKPWYQSASILGAITTGMISIASIMKINITDLAPDINSALFALGTVVGVAITIYGRIRAKHTIS